MEALGGLLLSEERQEIDYRERKTKTQQGGKLAERRASEQHDEETRSHRQKTETGREEEGRGLLFLKTGIYWNVFPRTECFKTEI